MKTSRNSNLAIHSKLTALLYTLRQTSGNKNRGPLLVDTFMEEPGIAEFFQLAATSTKMLGRMGLSAKLVSKALKMAGFEGAETWEPYPILELKWWWDGENQNRAVHADVLFDKKKIGEAKFDYSIEFVSMMQHLKNIGVRTPRR